MSTQDYENHIEDLKIKERRPSALNELKLILTYKPASEAVAIIQSTGISKILQCLNSSDKIQIELTCEVLKTCFEKFEAGEVIKIYISYIMYLLRHENECVRRLAIDEVYKTITNDTILLPLPKYIDLYVATAQMVCDQDVGISNKAVFITSNLSAEAYAKILEEMKIALECNSSSKCNAFEVIINISTKSYDLFNLCIDQGYIDYMANELQSDDILYQLNILELLSQLAIKPYGINYLIKQGILLKISELVRGFHQNPFGGLLIPGYMKFFGAIAHYYPKEIFQKYPVLLESLFDALDSEDATILPVALDTLGFIGSTIEGKMCLMALGSKYTQIVEKLGLNIKNSPTEIKIRSLQCIANLIGIDKDPKAKVDPIDNRVTLMTREWFRSLSKQPDAIDVLFENCKNPFPDITLAALTLLNAVCQHHWGEELVARTAGFIEYLLDRSVNFTKESKEIKYEIIKCLSHSTVFDENILTRLLKYVEQGPFYTEIVTQVAMEEE
ncbi:26S proteasome non-ATPase regulatory subunit 5 [Vanessa tameamea]|uniref:26S proteasome non-ATPase regulatory subunit 5 n=1 Tax=Vanessa tameamea TaxID=334116 RepID=A0A8B8ILK4_VANTA|nr:26S proteasome non-ATPase regulatory subunit 5 [Vanessa tameamea]